MDWDRVPSPAEHNVKANETFSITSRTSMLGESAMVMGVAPSSK
jgi:hypothetical protein